MLYSQLGRLIFDVHCMSNKSLYRQFIGVKFNWLSRRHPTDSLWIPTFRCHLIAYNFTGNSNDCVEAFREKCSMERKICRFYYSSRFERLNSECVWFYGVLGKLIKWCRINMYVGRIREFITQLIWH